MSELRFQELLQILFYLISIVVVTNHAAIMQNPKLINMHDGFLELKPNGSLILRSSLENSTNIWQEAIIFKTIFNAIRLMPLHTKNTLNQKIYGDGVEHKFPPFLERVIQRIQTYFSVYKYTDTSKEPVREENKPTVAGEAGGIMNETLDLNDIDVNLTGVSSNAFNRNNKTSTLSVNNKFTKPLKTSTTTTIRPILLSETEDTDEENEFIEIKTKKS